MYLLLLVEVTGGGSGAGGGAVRRVISTFNSPSRSTCQLRLLASTCS